MFARAAFVSPFLRRFAWYAKHVAGSVDRRTIAAGLSIMVVMVLLATALVSIFENRLRLDSVVESFNWSLLAIIGRAPTTFITSVGGWAVYWVMALFGVLVVATVTASIVGAVVNSLIQEGRGMGTSGFRDHIVVCGWNLTARDLISELQKDNRHLRIALIHDGDRNPAGDGVYFVKGSPTETADLERAGIRDAAAALLFPITPAPDADMRSILTALTIRSVAPKVRIVVEVNDPRNAEHMRRAGADELLVTSHMASRLLARSAIYPGLADLVADLVADGGTELYRVNLPPDFVGLDFAEASFRLRQQHHATLVAVRRGQQCLFGGSEELRLTPDDDLVIIAEDLGRLTPSELRPTDGLRATELGARPAASASPDGVGISDAAMATAAVAVTAVTPAAIEATARAEERAAADMQAPADDGSARHDSPLPEDARPHDHPHASEPGLAAESSALADPSGATSTAVVAPEHS
jgi:voltage-gated potassium channel